jgi:hypothetical protein
METKSTTDEDIVTLVSIGLAFGVFGGIGAMISGFFRPITDWAIEYKVLLQGSMIDVPLPWDVSLGLDWGRVFILVGVLAMLVLVIVYVIVRRHRKRTMVD